jgi:uncharacterized surface protein with fasciclin (FAS1) repeats
MACKEEKKDKESDKMEVSETDPARETEVKKEAMASSISGKAMASGNLDTLVTALKAADLNTMLSEPGSYTLFAPTNNAFSKLKKGTLEDLLKTENKEELKNVLQYHVVSGRITIDKLANAIKNGKGKYSFETVSGDELTAMMDGDQIVILDGKGKKSQIVQGNVEASNGVIHVINDVLMVKK